MSQEVKTETAAELGERLNAKRKEWFALYGDDGGASLKQEDVEKLRQLNDEMADLGAKKDKLEIAESAQRHLEEIKRDAQRVNALPTPQTRTNASGETQTHTVEVKSLNQVFRESQSYQALAKGITKSAMIEIPYATWRQEMGQKTLLQSTAWTFQADRRPGIMESVQLDITVSDLMLAGTVDGPSFSYMEETTFTNNAAPVAEGGTKPEAALAFTETTEQVRKIAVNLPATDEMLADVPGMEQFIRGRLSFMVERTREAQLLSGSGTSPALRGILNRTGIQTQAAGADPVPDAIYKAITKINLVDAEPTAIVMHPNDWQGIRLLRTTDGVYIWGNPSDTGMDRIWGLPVRKTTGITENTALVGAFRPFAEIRRRAGLTVTVSTEHSTFFAENKILIQAEERLGLAVYRPSAFCTVTGI